MKIEKVQIRTSKIHFGLCNLSYEERLKRLNFTLLKNRRLKGDLIEMNQVIRGSNEMEWPNSPRLRTYIDLTDPTQGVRDN